MLPVLGLVVGLVHTAQLPDLGNDVHRQSDAPEIVLGGQIDGVLKHRGQRAGHHKVDGIRVVRLVLGEGFTLALGVVPKTHVTERPDDHRQGSRLAPVGAHLFDACGLLVEDEVLQVGQLRVRTLVVLTAPALDAYVLDDVVPLLEGLVEPTPVLHQRPTGQDEVHALLHL